MVYYLYITEADPPTDFASDGVVLNQTGGVKPPEPSPANTNTGFTYGDYNVLSNLWSPRHDITQHS